MIQSMTIEARSGFTLVELMVAVAIMAILSAIAYPLYESQSRKGKRGDGLALLEEVAQAEQHYFSHMNKFTDVITDLPGLKSGTSAHGYYTVTVKVEASSFVATAEPATTDQKIDNCVFTLSNLGVRGATSKDASGTTVTDDATRERCLGIKPVALK